MGCISHTKEYNMAFLFESGVHFNSCCPVRNNCPVRNTKTEAKVWTIPQHGWLNQTINEVIVIFYGDFFNKIW